MKKHSSIILFVILLILVSAGMAGLWFGYGYLTSLKDEETKLKQDIAVESIRSTRLLSLKGTFDRASAEKEKIDGYFFSVTEEDWLRFAREMEKLREASGLGGEMTVSEFSRDAKLFSETITFTGTFDEVYRLLKLIENYPSRIVVKSFGAKMDGQARDSSASSIWTGTVSFDLTSVRQQK
jgi:hypothetical protein